MARLASAPLTLRIYAVVAIGDSLVAATVRGHLGQHGAVDLVGLVFSLAFIWFVLRGSRVAWSVVVFSDAAYLALAPFLTEPWWAIAFGAIALGFLLAPASRRYVWGSRLAST